MNNIMNTAKETGQNLSKSMDVDQAANDASVWTNSKDAEAGAIIDTEDSLIVRIFAYINGVITVIGLIDHFYFKY